MPFKKTIRLSRKFHFFVNFQSTIWVTQNRATFVESFKWAGGMPNILLEWMGAWGETTKRASLCSRAVENELLAREYIYLHHANRIFGVDSSATFDNKTIYHTSCILKQLLQWHWKIPNGTFLLSTLYILGMNEYRKLILIISF